MNRSKNAPLAAAGLCALLTLPSVGMAEDKVTRSIEELATESSPPRSTKPSRPTIVKKQPKRAAR